MSDELRWLKHITGPVSKVTWAPTSKNEKWLHKNGFLLLIGHNQSYHILSGKLAHMYASYLFLLFSGANKSFINLFQSDLTKCTPHHTHTHTKLFYRSSVWNIKMRLYSEHLLLPRVIHWYSGLQSKKVIGSIQGWQWPVHLNQVFWSSKTSKERRTGGALGSRLGSMC